MKKMKKNLLEGMKKQFTLIELIVVIIIVGILAAIVVPNISSLKEDAIPVAVSNNERALQTALDMYVLEHNGQLPTVIQPTIENPQPPNYSVLYPDYIRSKPEVGHYLIDVFGKVWGSTSVAPNQINYTAGEFSFKTVDTASEYELLEYGKTKEVNTTARSAVGKYKIKSFAKLPVEGQTAKDIYRVENPENKSLLVSAIDKYGLQAAPVGEEFLGVQDGFPISGTGTFFLITDANGKAVWDGLQTHEILPEGTSIEYSFSTSDDGKTYSEEFVNDISSVENSRYLKVKVDMKSSNKNEPTLKYLKVIFHLLDQEELVKVHIPTTPIVLSPSEEEKKFSETIDLGSQKPINSIEFVGKEKVNVSYQSSEDNITYSPSTPYVEELPDGRYVRVEIELERPNNYAPSPEVEKIIIGSSTKKKVESGTVVIPEEEKESIVWETINSMTIVEDATDIGDWVSVQTTEQEPSGTRMVYRLSTSNNETTWSGQRDYYSNINLIPEMESSRFLKVEVIRQRKAGTTNSPSLTSITIDYDRLGKRQTSKYNGLGNKQSGELPDETPPIQKENHFQLGAFVDYGKHYDGTDITWQVVQVKDGKAMLTMYEPLRQADGNLLVRPFDLSANEGENLDDFRVRNGSNNWATSDIRKWLNEDFYNEAFNHQEQVIQPVTHNYALSTLDLDQATIGTQLHEYDQYNALSNYKYAYKGTTTDKIYYLSIDEYYEILAPIPSNYQITAMRASVPVTKTKHHVGKLSFRYTLRDAFSTNGGSVRYVDYMYLMPTLAAKHVTQDNSIGTANAILPAMTIVPDLFQYGDGSFDNPHRIEKFKKDAFIEYGTFNGNPLLWEVIREENGVYMLHLSDLLKREDNTTAYGLVFDKGIPDGTPREVNGVNDWEQSDIRQWLNGEFLTNLPNSDTRLSNNENSYLLNSLDKDKASSGTEPYKYTANTFTKFANYDAAYKNSTIDKVTLPSIYETYHIIEPQIGERFLKPNGQNVARTWLRDASPESGSKVMQLTIGSYNLFSQENHYNAALGGAVRPIIYMDKSFLSHGDGTLGTRAKPYTVR